MAVGIENIVSDTAKAFEGNPAALQQRYMQKQDLFDLLALNMIRKEQDAIKRGLLLKQQQMPGTILEQVEGEVRKNTADMAKGVEGALRNKQAQTQSNINKVASAGVSGVPADNMKKLADGGIIGFSRGGGAKKTVTTDMVTQEMIDKYKERQRKRGRRGNLNLSDDEIKQRIVDQENSFLGSDYFIKRPESEGGQMSRKRKPVEEAEEDKKVDTGIAQLQPKVDVGLQEALRKQNIKPDVKPPVVDEKKPVVPVDDLAQDKSAGIPAATSAFDAGKFAVDDAFNKQVKGGISDLINQDPQKAVDFAARTPAEQAFIAKMLKERTDMRASMMDPDKLQTDRLLQSLLSAKGATPGEAFRTAGLGAINAERAQEKLRRSEFDALNKLFMDEANRTQTLKKAAFQDALGAKKQGVASGTSLTASEKTAALEADKLFATIENNKIANKLKSDLNDITAKRIEATEKNTLANVDTALLRDLTNVEKTASSQFLKEYQAKMDSLLTSGKKREERDKLEKQYKQEYELALENLRNGIAAERDAIKGRLTARSGGIDTSGFTVKKKS